MKNSINSKLIFYDARAEYIIVHWGPQNGKFTKRISIVNFPALASALIVLGQYLFFTTHRGVYNFVVPHLLKIFF